MNPLDIYYEEDENGQVNTSNISYFNVIEGAKDWCKLPVRPYDQFINTTKGPIRVPSVVICSRYQDVPRKRGQFSTKGNIAKRDNGVCQYTGIKLPKDKISIDHILPISKCHSDYNPNTWENQVVCHRELNTWKADRLPDECVVAEFDPFCPLLKEWKSTYVGKTLKLLTLPKKPSNTDSIEFFETMEAWNIFLKGS